MIDCNREEAFRAREMAVKKMENRDFVGAEKIVLKAQKLFPELENISKLLTICNVHCAAELRVNGEMDLYGILQVEEGADEALIRKQYRKLAFSLHPDKNCFVGAEAAFKLVAEAHSVLCDPTKRSQYDLKRKSGFRNVPKPAKQQPSKKVDSNKRSRPGLGETFWTICSHCQIRYQYYIKVLNTMVQCMSCKRNFFAYNLYEHPMPTSSSVPNGSQVPANMFPNKQRDTQSQQGHPVKPSCTGRGTNVKPNGSQDPSHMFPNQQHGVPCQNSHPEKPSAGGNTDVKLRMNVAQHDEYIKGYSRPVCDEKANHPDMSRGKFQYSTLNQEKSSVPTENRNMHGRSMPDSSDPNIFNKQKLVREDASAKPDAMNMPCSAKLSSVGRQTDADSRINVAGRRSMQDPVDPNITDRRNLTREDASTVPSAAGSSGTRRSGRRKQDADGNIFLNIDTKKRQRKNDFPSNVRQPDPPHVSSNVDVQEMEKTTDTGDQGNIKEEAPEVDTSDEDNIKEEAPETVSEKKPSYSEVVTFPDPDIFNFEEFRDINLFAVGQIWALYDNLDGMPRYYARIKQFDASNFKVHLAWLEYDAMDEAEECWTNEELPTACGNFCLGKGTDVSQDRSMFSHIAAWVKGKKRNSYVIYPNKGEVWALYKGWSMEWSSDADNHRSYEYEVVEVLSNMSVNDGATVIPLVRIKGFVSLFATAKDKSSFVIPSSELLRFSHSIPFYRTNGNEKVGVPGGFLELDNACLPADLDAAFSSVTLDSYMSLGKKESGTFVDMTTDNTSRRADPGDEQIAQKENNSEAHACQPPEQNTTSKKTAGDANEFGDFSLQNDIPPSVYTYPDSDFHSFEEGRSCEKILRGQIWALFSEVDKFPKFYAWIRKVKQEPFRVQLVWLEACPEHEQEKRWLEQDIPISCGTFRVVRNWNAMYDTMDTFSHEVYARDTGTRWEVTITPEAGEIWAIYMNWAPDWVPSSTGACEFAICEVINRTEASTSVAFLAQVSGYLSVFRPDKQKGVLEVPAQENLRFSHRIPSFRLTEEQGGKLRGFYELDPASVPDAFLYRDT
ncbi:hypothetical protein SEVIR_8G171500v4 [Setaria viridis]|uniref:J domain-containing protein n=1 Tax=Setaria viridis TaxID=4556 RepID=A0A4U6TJI6_SETVI|nr:uncharacterized protein LOC117833181 [Setaria viridis]XP_034568493.1 uncharacterized protein LOC117833181 [Setaria viridis]TKW01313.1 hypothetical protein SEVIR_8G171500v2 [Setaria viridis]TKW01314.1 hypothetical protein SEVIR_8G171500v2 [Setaria viridis]